MIYQCHFQSGQHHTERSKQFQGGKKHKVKKASPMANIMTSFHVVWQLYSCTYIINNMSCILTQAHTMPQICLERMPQMFHSKGHQQEAIKKIWKLIQDSLCVRIHMHVLNYLALYIYSIHIVST